MKHTHTYTHSYLAHTHRQSVNKQQLVEGNAARKILYIERYCICSLTGPLAKALNHLDFSIVNLYMFGFAEAKAKLIIKHMFKYLYVREIYFVIR